MIISFGGAVGVVLLGVFALPPVIEEVQQLVTQLPDLLERLRTASDLLLSLEGSISAR